MKKIDISKLAKNSWFIFSAVFILLTIFISNASAIAGIMLYWSDNDYTNPNSSLSWSVNVWTWESLTWATSFTFTQAVKVSSGTISVIIPNNSIITNANWSSFNLTSVYTWVLPNLPFSIQENEQDVWKIKFWINWIKLNFSKPVKLSIPVNTSKTTVRILVKHFWDTTYQTSSLTDSISSSCNSGNAVPSTSVAPVVNWIATIYTCSASEFVAVTDKNVVVSSGWSGGGSGWYKILIKDTCPKWDNSKSYYDNDCWNATIITKTNSKGSTNTWTIVNTWSLDYSTWTIFDSNSDEELSLINTKKRIVNYKWMKIVVIDWYKLSTKTAIVTKKIIENDKMSLSEKQNFINRVNEFLISKYNLDIVKKKSITLKNQYIRQYFLLKMTIKNLER